MKTKFFILIALSVILSGTISKGQEVTDNFLIQDAEIIWQRVYPTDIKFDKLVTYFKESGLLQTIESSDNKIIGDLKVLDCYTKEIERNFSSSSAYDIKTNNFTGFYIIEYREGKYRVTIKRIKMVSDNSENDDASIRNLENYAFKADSPQFRNNFLLYTGKGLNYVFSKMFEVKGTKDENW